MSHQLINLIKKAKNNGFEVTLNYIGLNNLAMSKKGKGIYLSPLALMPKVIQAALLEYENSKTKGVM